MKLVIDIPEAVYKCVMDGTYCGTLYEELKNGVPVDTSGDCISRQAVIETIETDCSWDIFNEWGSRTPTGESIIEAIKRVPSVEPERKFIEKVLETLREMDGAVDVICNLDVDAVLDRMEVDGWEEQEVEQ